MCLGTSLRLQGSGIAVAASVANPHPTHFHRGWAFRSGFPFLIQDIFSAAWPRVSESLSLVQDISSAVSASPPGSPIPAQVIPPAVRTLAPAFQIRVQDIALAVGALTRHPHSGAHNPRTLVASLGPRNVSARRNPDTGYGPGVCSHRSPAATHHTATDTALVPRIRTRGFTSWVRAFGLRPRSPHGFRRLT